eukprot:5387741-Amphidinium_carterae.1
MKNKSGRTLGDAVNILQNHDVHNQTLKSYGPNGLRATSRILCLRVVPLRLSAASGHPQDELQGRGALCLCVTSRTRHIHWETAPLATFNAAIQCYGHYTDSGNCDGWWDHEEEEEEEE